MPDFDIEQVNRVRKAMGMKPLPVPGGDDGPTFRDEKAGTPSDDEPASTLETREAAAGDNWKRLEDEAKTKAKRQAQKDAIKKARDAAQRFAKLEGKGLADDDEDGGADAKSWLRGQKKRQAALEKARKYEQQLAELEQQAQYTSADLSGVKVGHQLSQFDDAAGEQILTLKDAAVDAESEDDELENVDLRDREKLEQRLDSKKKRPAYNPMDDDDGTRGILDQYDEEIDGKKKQQFTLDGQGSTREAAQALDDPNQNSKGVTISLDIFEEDKPMSDYKDASEVKIRKPKKSKAKTKKRRAEDEDDIFPEPSNDDTHMNGTESKGTVAKRRRTEDHTFVDDEDLQATLALQRVAALKKRKKRTPEEIAREIREEASATPGAAEDEEEDGDEPGMVIDETSEFLSNLQVPTAPERRRRRSVQPDADSPPTLQKTEEVEDADEDMDDVAEAEMLEPKDFSREETTTADVTATGLEEEASLNRGLGASLNLLKQRGVIKTAESGDINATYRERQRFLAEKQRRETEAEQRARLQRERDRQSGKLDRMSAREREEYARRTNASRDQIESRQLSEVFNREYKPDVELKYVDEFGRSMDAKEAFKHLSHQFHGKGSGKQKTEKKLKKIDDEKRKTAMSVLDASQNSTNMNSVAGERSKKSRQAGVRLQ